MRGALCRSTEVALARNTRAAQIQKAKAFLRMRDQTPLACDLTVIGNEEREQHHQIAEEIFAAVEELRELPDGYAFRLPTESEMIRRAGMFISRERLCCPFFDFTLEVKPDQGPVWMNVTGREGTKQFLKENIASQLEENGSRRGAA